MPQLLDQEVAAIVVELDEERFVAASTEKLRLIDHWLPRDSPAVQLFPWGVKQAGELTEFASRAI